MSVSCRRLVQPQNSSKLILIPRSSMLWPISALGFMLSTLPSILATNSTTNGTSSENLTADLIMSMGNNTLFNRWRPTSHFIAPAGWMNDPCGMMYDPNTDTYHVHYQWHPYHVNWGNISWGHATSKDLITWTDVGGWEGNGAQSLVTGPNGSYNHLGIFSGTAQPVNLTGGQDGTIIAFYTSVQHLPTSWAIHYIPGTESQSIAISKDGGNTWEQYEGNPILSDPPEGWNITGWRDPFVDPWPAMDNVLGQTEPHYYAVLGSGIKGVGPRIPFYSAPARNLTDWTFLGALWEPADNTSLGATVETGTYGFNFEVSNFFSLEDEDGNLHYYVMMGTEGGNTTLHPRAQWGLWNEGIVSRRANGSAQFTPVAGGAIDSGLLYAVTSFNDTKNNRRVQWGWAPEDSNNFGINQQGYQGAFALPREMYVKKTTGIINADGNLTTLGNNRLIEHSDGTYTAYTLGARPVPEVVQGIRNGTIQKNYASGTINSSSISGEGSSHIEISATFSNFTGPAGVTIAASPGGEEYTTISFDPDTFLVSVNRTYSSTIYQFSNYTVVGYFYPYTLEKSGKKEDVEMHVYLDGSLLEVYVNDRFWLTTRVYPSRTDSTGYGVYVADGASVQVSNVAVWTGLANVFPERPLNSSSQLVFDTPEETDNYIWWAGN
ncbi:glycoside hydrolase family 32 protein [Pleomassaria siparia CBS 279.74]|uniref:Glycoside hydrolase family 32 protein n=1 Tax=Pleomassaria siparia CBS 279.74 TaxID=1314801 RepID=A0A6G1K4K9_9PLEO|nr:glycoside hydrolase family 32 protein [Pleomassaria siparia CBS 279.74]